MDAPASRKKSQGSRVPRPAKAGSKAERDALRQEMLVGGCSLELIATEMERRWGFRPREAYRHAHGWSQDAMCCGQPWRDSAPSATNSSFDRSGTGIERSHSRSER